MIIKKLKRSFQELFYGYSERERFISEIEDPLDTLIKKAI